MSTFKELYKARFKAGKYVCVGLDPDLSQIPDSVPGASLGDKVYNFLVKIIDATYGHAAAYKLQIAYYEDLGLGGPDTLRRVIKYIRSVDPTIPITLDYKRADIGRTNEPYVRVAFDFYGVDAVTVHPYLGMEAMKPFLDCEDKTIIVLCRTSNPGAGELQDVECQPWLHMTSRKLYSTIAEASRETGHDCVPGEFVGQRPMPLYQFIAHRVAQSWNKNGNCAVVVGATYPAELEEVRKIVGDDVLILIPGLGTQEGDLAKSIENGKDSEGWGIILNNSSAILFAFKKLKNEDDSLKYAPEQFAEAAAEATRTMNDAVATLVV